MLSSLGRLILGGLALGVALALMLGRPLEGRVSELRVSDQFQPEYSVSVPGIVSDGEVFPSDGPQGVFQEGFDGLPESPQPFSSERWDVQVHERGMAERQSATFDAMQAQHGPGCEGPTLAHTVSDAPNAVFRCNDHVMTAINGPEYGIIVLTPDHMVDFSRGEAVIRFDVNTADQSARDWIEVYITPFEDNYTLPWETWSGPDLNQAPDRAVRIQQNFDRNSFRLQLIENHVDIIHEDSSVGDANTTGAFVPSFSRRDTVEVRISRTHIKVWMPDYNIVFQDRSIDLDWEQGVVQFSQHSYAPEKDGAGSPNTWHWDNFYISPAVPFQIVPTSNPFITSSGTVTFPPAPPSAYLRFNAGMGVTVNGALVDPQGPWTNADHVHSYLVPIPPGSTSAMVSVGSGSMMAKGFYIWVPPP